jgi:4-amino-4-deoxy-L-arabinose transferase-like glycosyltransferase
MPRRICRSPASALGLCAASAAALRLPFAFTGLVPDEGGYAYVAQQWSRGAQLYDSAWADRPQGFLVAYRLLLAVADDPWAIRLGAVLCGAGITVLLGVIGWQLRSPATGIAAAAMYAVVGVGPRVTGFTFNGELAAALPATAAIAATLAWRSSARLYWLVAAGLAGGSAILMKQSAFDGLLVAIAVVAVVSKDWSTRRRALAVLLGSAAIPVAASMLHGCLIGWTNYWSAVVGSRFGARLDAGSLLDRPGRFFATVDDAWSDLAVVVLLALAALALGRRQRGPVAVPAFWLGTALLGFNLGALYWRHYYVQLIPPLTLLAAMAVTSFRSRLYQSAAVTLAILPVGSFLVALVVMPPERREGLIAHQRQFEHNKEIAAQLDERLDQDDTIYVLVSQGDLYFLVGRPSRYPYLWGHPVKEIPGALQQLRELLSSERRPEWLIAYTSPKRVDSSGRLGRIVRRHYVQDPTFTSERARILRERADLVA